MLCWVACSSVAIDSLALRRGGMHIPAVRAAFFTFARFEYTPRPGWPPPEVTHAPGMNAGDTPGQARVVARMHGWWIDQQPTTEWYRQEAMAGGPGRQHVMTLAGNIALAH